MRIANSQWLRAVFLKIIYSEDYKDIISDDFQFVDETQFYLPLDIDLRFDAFQTDIDFLSWHWRMVGRPLFIMPLSSKLLGLKSMHPMLLLFPYKMYLLI